MVFCDANCVCLVFADVQCCCYWQHMCLDYSHSLRDINSSDFEVVN